MAFAGDLQHLPIVDVIQLLHSTRKSGILTAKSRKGESQLVFKDGYIVSASHLNNSVRIGQILIDLKIISAETLDLVLLEQRNAGAARRPLIVTMIEMGLVNEENAYKGLEHLIEMTVVEILTWKKGTFALDSLPTSVADEYKYYPEKMTREINVDTQGVLMDALRIFDEKMRDGELTDEEFPDEELAADGTSPSPEEAPLSADDLGLADLDHLEAKGPKAFTGLAEFDPFKFHRQKLQETAPELLPDEREALVTYLGKFAPKPDMAARKRSSGTLVFFTSDSLIAHAVTTVCAHAGFTVLATGAEQDLAPTITRAREEGNLPLLIFDFPRNTAGGVSRELVPSLRHQTRVSFPELVILQLADCSDYAFALDAYRDGVRAVLPRPYRGELPGTFVQDIISFLETLPTCVQGAPGPLGKPLQGKLQQCFLQLRTFPDVPDVALAILKFVAESFARSLTLILRETELIAEKGIGLKGEKGLGPTTALGFRIPLGKSSLLRTVIDEGGIFFGQVDDPILKEHLFAAIGAPARATILLLPLKSCGKTISLTYADFGSNEVATVETDLLRLLMGQAELVLENSLFRKKFAKAH